MDRDKLLARLQTALKGEFDKIEFAEGYNAETYEKGDGDLIALDNFSICEEEDGTYFVLRWDYDGGGYDEPPSINDSEIGRAKNLYELVRLLVMANAEQRLEAIELDLYIDDHIEQEKYLQI